MTTRNGKKISRAVANKNDFAAAKRTTLLAQLLAARDSLTILDKAVTNLLEGQNAIGGKALVAAYSFTIACMERQAEAAKLSGWKDAAVQSGNNDYCQPLKLLAGDLDNVPQSRISIWAAVFRNAHAAKIKPKNFLEHRKRNHGMRQWYDAIIKAKAANDNEPGVGSQKSSGAGSKATTNGKATKSTPLDIVAAAKNAKRIGFVMVEWDAYLCDSDAQAELESNPAVIGLIKAAPTKCRKFVNDNDPRFVGKAVA